MDAGLRAFREGSGAGWSRTVVAVVTEFGRTAAANGTAGTDHGTGGLAFLAGGAVRGGRVAGDWPGLAPADLNEGRDLRATSDMRALFKGVLGPHLGLAEAVLETQVFPDSRDVRAPVSYTHLDVYKRQGVNGVTGDYSRGAAGFWVEDGQLAWPVDEATIAGNLRTMFAGIAAVGSEVDPRSHIRIGPVLVGRMTVAGGQ